MFGNPLILIQLLSDFLRSASWSFYANEKENVSLGGSGGRDPEFLVSSDGIGFCTKWHHATPDRFLGKDEDRLFSVRFFVNLPDFFQL